MFDARRYRESLEKPTFIDVDESGNEVRFEGKIVSFNTVAVLVDEFSRLAGKSEDEINDLIFKVVSAIEMDTDVMQYLLALPLAGRLEAVLSFFECLRGIKKVVQQ